MFGMASHGRLNTEAYDISNNYYFPTNPSKKFVCKTETSLVDASDSNIDLTEEPQRKNFGYNKSYGLIDPNSINNQELEELRSNYKMHKFRGGGKYDSHQNLQAHRPYTATPLAQGGSSKGSSEQLLWRELEAEVEYFEKQGKDFLPEEFMESLALDEELKSSRASGTLSIMDKIKMENALMRKKENFLNQEFENVKAVYSRLAKEKTNIQNKQYALSKREGCLTNEKKKFLSEDCTVLGNRQNQLRKITQHIQELRKENDMLQLEEQEIMEKIKLTEEKIYCISRRNMSLPRSLFLTQRSNLRSLLKKQIQRHNISEPRAGFQAFFEGTNKEKDQEDEEKRFREERKNKLYKDRLCLSYGLEEKFDRLGYLHVLRNKNRDFMKNIENERKEAAIMRAEIKKMREVLGE